MIKKAKVSSIARLTAAAAAVFGVCLITRPVMAADPKECCTHPDVVQEHAPSGEPGSSGSDTPQGRLDVIGIPTGGGGSQTPPGGTPPPADATLKLAEFDKRIGELKQELNKLEPIYEDKFADLQAVQGVRYSNYIQFQVAEAQLEGAKREQRDINAQLNEVKRVMESSQKGDITLRESQQLELKSKKDDLEHELTKKEVEIGRINSKVKEAADTADKNRELSDQRHAEFAAVAVKVNEIKNNIAGWQAARDMISRNVRDYR